MHWLYGKFVATVKKQQKMQLCGPIAVHINIESSCRSQEAIFLLWEKTFTANFCTFTDSSWAQFHKKADFQFWQLVLPQSCQAIQHCGDSHCWSDTYLTLYLLYNTGNGDISIPIYITRHFVRFDKHMTPTIVNCTLGTFDIVRVDMTLATVIYVNWQLWYCTCWLLIQNYLTWHLSFRSSPPIWHQWMHTGIPPSS